MPQLRSACPFIVCGLLSIGCGADDAQDPQLTWQGGAAHLMVKGHLNGEDLDVAITGEDAADTATLWCGREYGGPPDANGDPDVTRAKLYKTNIYAQVTIGGEDRRLELELKPHDFQADAVPSTTRIIARVDEESVATDATWLDFEWHTPDGEGDLLETSAQTGTFELELYSGEPGADGLIIPAGEGSIGGRLDAKWSENERLQVSVTAPCTESELDLE
jgi:hypothetical protein